MKEFKGTKGEWHVGEDYNVYDENGFDIVEMSSPMRIKENWEDTGVRHWSEKKGISCIDTTGEEVLANAQLIATAPELLKRLNSLVLSIKAHPDYQTGRNQEFVDYVNMGEQTINKALGL